MNGNTKDEDSQNYLIEGMINGLDNSFRVRFKFNGDRNLT